MYTETDHGPGGFTSPGFRRDHGRDVLDASVGIVLIAVGGIFFAQQFLGLDPWRWSWPLLIVLPGAIMLVAACTTGRRTSGLAVPGTIMSTLGLILLFQNTFHAWQTWAYAWALVVPTSIGVGLWLHGLLSDREKVQRTGRVMATIGLWLFVGFAAFFELVLNLSRTFENGIGGPGIAVVLIVAGAFVILRPLDRAST